MLGLLHTLPSVVTGWLLDFDDAIDGAWDLSDPLLWDDGLTPEDRRAGARR